MCICFFQVNPPGSPYPFIFCGNRDEFLSRESIVFHKWDDDSGIYGGKDAVRGGTWLGVKPAKSPTDNKYKFAVVHNFRHNEVVDPSKRSRGDLPVNFLKGQWTAKEYAEKVAHEGYHYMGFTLILADETGVYFTSNRGHHRMLEPGIYALSNSLLDTPWPKVPHGKENFRQVLKDYMPKMEHHHDEEDELLHQLCHVVLQDNTLFPHPLPRILDAHTEVLLSSVFIEPFRWKDFGFYGTRMRTTLVVRKDGSIRGHEHSLDTASPVKDWRGSWSKVKFEVSFERSSL